MSRATIWLVIVSGTLVTYAMRLSFTVIFPAEKLPSAVRHALRFAPPAVLAAIAIPEILLPGSNSLPDPTHPQTIAGLVAAVVAWRTGSTWLTIAVGMILLLLLKAMGL